jgi:hypothetical protein
MAAKRYSPEACDEFLGSTSPSRASVDRLVSRAEVLSRADQALIAAIYLKHQTLAAVACLQGTSVRVVRRRLYSIIRRVHTPEFIYVVRRRARWPEQQRRVATAIFLRGLTMRQTARGLKLPYFTVRRLRDVVLALITAALDESARAKAGEEHRGDGENQREQRGGLIGGAAEGCAGENAPQSPSNHVSLKFPTSSHFGEVA